MDVNCKNVSPQNPKCRISLVLFADDPSGSTGADYNPRLVSDMQRIMGAVAAGWVDCTRFYSVPRSPAELDKLLTAARQRVDSGAVDLVVVGDLPENSADGQALIRLVFNLIDRGIRVLVPAEGTDSQDQEPTKPWTFLFTRVRGIERNPWEAEVRSDCCWHSKPHH